MSVRATGMFGVLLYFLIQISYGQNARTSSGLTIDQLRCGLHTFQQLDKDTNAGNLTASDLNNAHIACNQLKQSGAPDVHVSSLIDYAKIVKRLFFISISVACFLFIPH